MKKLLSMLVLIVAVLLHSCSDGSQQSENASANEGKSNQLSVQVADSTDDKTTLHGDSTVRTYDLSMYNEKYSLTIYPGYNVLKNQFQSHILLTKRSDTIISQEITIDMFNTSRYIYPKDSSERIDFPSQYYFVGTEYWGVRSDDLHLFTKMVSKTDITDTMETMVKFKYRGKQTGEFWFNVL